MRILKYPEASNAELAYAPLPEPGISQALIKVVASNVSSGTEMAFFRGTAAQMNHCADSNGIWHEVDDAITFPMYSNAPDCWWMGYACVGEVVKKGAEFTGAELGDMVFVTKCHQQFHLIDNDGFVPVPKEISPEQASFIALLEIAYNGFLDANVKLLDKVVIFGMGTIGQLLVQICKLSGVYVVAVDYLDSRLQLAQYNGADHIINPMKIQQLTAERIIDLLGEKADAVIEASGNSKALNDAVACVKNDGQVTVVSFYQQAPSNFLMGQEFHHNRVIIRSSQVGGISPALTNHIDHSKRSARTMELLGKIDAASLISHRCNFADYPELIQVIDRNPAETLAVVIKYPETKSS